MFSNRHMKRNRHIKTNKLKENFLVVFTSVEHIQKITLKSEWWLHAPDFTKYFSTKTYKKVQKLYKIPA